MTLYAGTQQSVATPNQYFVGDFYGLPQQANPIIAFTADPDGSGIAIGTFAFGMPTTNNLVSQLYTSGRTVAGFVYRSQEEVWNIADTNLGYSFKVGAGRSVSVAPNGSFVTKAPSLNVGGVILLGDIIISNNTDGTLRSQTSATVPTGYTLVAGWKVIATGLLVDYNSAGVGVAISNVRSF